MKLSRNFYQETNHACNRGRIIHSENRGFIFNIREKLIFISSPWIWAIWYWESKELAQWSPALGLHIFQILRFWVLIQPLWRNGQEGDQLGPTSSPVQRYIFFCQNNLSSKVSTSETQSLNSCSVSCGPASMAPRHTRLGMFFILPCIIPLKDSLQPWRGLESMTSIIWWAEGLLLSI